MEVEPTLQPMSVPGSDVLNHIIQNILPLQPTLGPPPLAAPSDKERTRFMAFMNWNQKMETLKGDHRKHMSITSLLSPPDKRQEDPIHKLKPTFLSLMERANTFFGGGSNQAFAVRNHILHSADVAHVP